jgi:hypothetical protein
MFFCVLALKCCTLWNGQRVEESWIVAASCPTSDDALCVLTIVWISHGILLFKGI